jgi:hypothetical protein
MFSSTDEIVQRLQKLYIDYQWLISYKIEQKSVSVLKAKIIFSEEMFIQIYINIRKPKISYNLILNGSRLYGRDFTKGEWHLHPYGKEQVHDDSMEGRKEVSLETFFFEVLQILEEDDMY